MTLQDYEQILSDQSTATPKEKLSRFLTALSDPRGNPVYFFGDGYPKRTITTDAAAFLGLLESGAICEDRSR